MNTVLCEGHLVDASRDGSAPSGFSSDFVMEKIHSKQDSQTDGWLMEMLAHSLGSNDHSTAPIHSSSRMLQDVHSLQDAAHVSGAATRGATILWRRIP